MNENELKILEVAGTKDAINMVEADAKEVSEEECLKRYYLVMKKSKN